MSLNRALAVGLMLSWMSPAAAQFIPESTVTLTPEERAAQATDLKGKATVAFTAGNYELALQRIEKAIKLSDDIGLVANKGLILEKLGRFKEAAAAFRAYLAAAPEGDSKATMARTLLARLEPEIFVTTTPTGATVTIQGQAAPLGTTPLKKRLQAGTHLFLVELEGYERVRKVARVVAGEGLKLNVDLKKKAPPPAPAVPLGPGTEAVPKEVLTAKVEVSAESSGGGKSWTWIALGGAALAAGSAGFFYTQGLDAAEARDRTTTGASWDAEQAILEQKNTLYLTSTGLAVLAGLVGTYLLLGSSEASPTTLSATPGSATFSIEF